LASLQNRVAPQADAPVESSMALYLNDIGAAKWTLYPHTNTTHLYGWRSTNFVESENAAALSTRAKNPTQFFQYFIEKWVTTKFKRCKESLRWKKQGKMVTPKYRSLIAEQGESARYHEVTMVSASIEYALDMRGCRPVRRRVAIAKKTCTCSFYFQYGMACGHIISVLRAAERPEPLFESVDECYYVDTYLNTHNADASNIELVIEDEIELDSRVSAPSRIRKRGFPKTKMIPSQGEEVSSKRLTRCSHCQISGHNRRTCPQL